MDARRTLLVALGTLATFLVSERSLFADQYRTTNFVVIAPDSVFARQVGEEAERFRKELAELWLGKELPAWPQPCPITVEIAPHAGGETSFAFVPDGRGGSRPVDWRMKIYGSPVRILDSVLPHEVTHTIFATHYGRPLPRWADEGACTTVEHQSERERNQRMLIEFLSTNRGIPFNHMFAMKQYPSDILPLYAQGYSLARFLVMQKGHRHFVKFVGEGMDREVPGREPQTWNEVSHKYYGVEDLSDLQLQWMAWVKKGCPRFDDDAVPAETIAADSRLHDAVASTPAAPTHQQVAATNTSESLNQSASESWYVRQSRIGGSATLHHPGNAEQRPAASDGIRHEYAPGSVRVAADQGTIWR